MLYRAVIFTFIPTALELFVVCAVLAHSFSPVVVREIKSIIAQYRAICWLEAIQTLRHIATWVAFRWHSRSQIVNFNRLLQALEIGSVLGNMLVRKAMSTVVSDVQFLGMCWTKRDLAQITHRRSHKHNIHLHKQRHINTQPYAHTKMHTRRVL